MEQTTNDKPPMSFMRWVFAIFGVLVMLFSGGCFLYIVGGKILSPARFEIVMEVAASAFAFSFIPFLIGLFVWWLIVRKSPRAVTVQKKWWRNTLRSVTAIGFLAAIVGVGFSLYALFYESDPIEALVLLLGGGFVFTIGTLISVVAWYLQSGSSGLPDNSVHHQGGNNAN